jgi:hypothetical protein
MNKDEYYSWVAENDTYPEHSHKWIVRTYTDTSNFNPNELFYRNFGPFETKEEAQEFIENYKDKYTKPGFISRYSIEPLCEVLK